MIPPCRPRVETFAPECPVQKGKANGLRREDNLRNNGRCSEFRNSQEERRHAGKQR